MNHVRKILTTTLTLTILIPHLCQAKAGKSGVAFLKLGVSGRALAMGEAMSANVSGAAATYYNPAGILSPLGGSSTQLMFMHKEWIQETRVEFLAASIPLGSDDAIGFALNSTTISDIEIRTRPGTPEGTFTARNFSLGASYAHSFSEDLRVGLTGKLLYQKILVDESSGFAFDIGGQYRTSIEDLTIGAAVVNLGSMRGLRGGKTTLPSLVRIGPAYSFQLENITSRLDLASDYVFIFPERKSYLNVGSELAFNQIVAARLGYQFGSEGRGLAVGLGISHGIFALDYAYSHLSADLGNTHALSVALNL